MTAVELGQLFTLYTWFALAALLFILALIARTYQNLFAERTRFRWFVVPTILFGASAVRYASIDRAAGDLLGDGLSALAGVIVIGLSLALFRQMTRGRTPRRAPHDSPDEG